MTYFFPSVGRPPGIISPHVTQRPTTTITTRRSTVPVWWSPRPRPTSTTRRPWWKPRPTKSSPRPTPTTKKPLWPPTHFSQPTPPSTTPFHTTTTVSSFIERPPAVATTPVGLPATAGPCKTGTKEVMPGDCTSFRMCNNGNWLKVTCGLGLHWNNRLKICDWPHQAKCSSEYVTIIFLIPAVLSRLTLKKNSTLLHLENLDHLVAGYSQLVSKIYYILVHQ